MLRLAAVGLLFSLCGSLTASVLPLRLRFAAGLNPQLRGVAQCAGHESDPMQLLEGSSPDEICMPGSVEMNIKTDIKEDLPTDLTLALDLKKITPFPMNVPCLDGIGSCKYELCPMIENMGDTICGSFPPSQPCGCPLLQGILDMQGVVLPVDDMGPILGAVMEGDYHATAQLYGASNPGRSIGCIELTFSLKQC